MEREQAAVISAIIPIYETPEAYLRACIDSVLCQTYPHFELFLVDDGSKNGAALLCDSYAKKDARITVIHQKNAGVSAARNAALPLARGAYLTFLDSDDLLLPDAWERAVAALENARADCVVFGWKDFSQDASFDHIVAERPQIVSGVYFQAEVAADNYRCGGGYPWNKLWRASSLKRDPSDPSAPLPFNTAINIYEDKLWILQAVANDAKILLMPDVLYHYRYLSSSLTQDESRRIPRLLAAYHSYDLILDCLEEKNKAAYITAYNFYFSFCLHDLRFLKEDEKATGRDHRRQYKKTLRHFHALCRRIRPRTLHVPVRSREFALWLFLHFLPLRSPETPSQA